MRVDRQLNNALQIAMLVVVSVFGALFNGSAFAEDPPTAVGPLLKLYRSGRLPADRQPAVIEMICARGNEHDLRVVLDKLLEKEGMPESARLKAMAGLVDAATTRKVKPVGDLKPLGALVESAKESERLATVRLVSALNVTTAGPGLKAIAFDSKSSADLRKGAIAGLVTLKGDDNRAALVELCGERQPISTRLQAAAGLVEFDVKLAAKQASEILAKTEPADDIGPVLDAFFDRRDGSDELATALMGTKLKTDVAKKLLRTMYSVGRSDAQLSNVLSQAAGIAADLPPPTQEEVAQIVRETAEKGDAHRGEAIFRRLDLSCMRCHSVSRAGGQVGPELSAVGGSSPVDYIANSILNPNLAVKEQFVTRVFELESGKVLSGVVIDRDETRVRIRDVQGKVVVIPTADIEEELEGASMMPMGLTKFLTRSELLDLIKFVSEMGRPGEFAVQTVPRIQRWQYLKSPTAELIDAVPHLDHIRQFVIASEPDAWTSVYARVLGVYPLSELRKQPGRLVVILRGEVQVNEAGELGLDFETRETFQAWIDAQPLSVSPSNSASTTLQPGKHSIILRVEISDTDSPELRVQLSKPAGSTIQFEVVGGA